MTGMLTRYERLVAAGELRSDPDQRRAAERLDRLQRDNQTCVCFFCFTRHMMHLLPAL